MFENYLTTRMAAQEAGVTVDYINKAIKREPPQLAAVKFGDRWMIHRDVFAAWQAKRRRPGRPAIHGNRSRKPGSGKSKPIDS